MSKLIEATHVSLGGEVGTEWARPYLDDQHARYASELLTAADALLLGRLTYEGLSVAYTGMAQQAPPGVPTEFIDRMNHIPKTPCAIAHGVVEVWPLEVGIHTT
jgi:hypothetical protein